MITILSVIAAFFAAITIHESAHLLTALALRMKVESMTIGAGGRGWTIKTPIPITLKPLPFHGHIVVPFTVDWRKWVAVHVAGPLANLLTLAFVWPPNHGAFGGALFFVSLFMAVENMLPTLASDGGRIKRTLERRAARLADFAAYERRMKES